MHASLSRWIIRGAVAALLLACGDSSGPGNQTPAITRLETASNTLTIPRGDFAKIYFAVEKNDAYSGDVTLAIEDVTPGIVASVAPKIVSGAKSLVEVTVTVLTSAQAGQYSFTVAASGVAIATKRTTVAVNVTEPGIALSLGQSSISFEQAQSVDIPITITRNGGYRGNVGFSLIGLPTGVTAVFDPPSLGEGVTTSTLTLSAAITAPLGSTNITVRASGQLVETQSVPLAINVTELTIPTVTIAADPTTLNVVQGDSNTVNVTITRYAGYNGPVDLTSEEVHEGVMVVPTTIPEGESTIGVQLKAAGDAILGLGTYTLRATASGMTPRTRLLSVRVLAAAPYHFSFGNDDSRVGTVTVARGSSADVTMSVVRRNGYTSPVTLTMIGVPDGVTLTGLPGILPFTQNSETQLASFTVNVSPDATPGQYQMVVRGVGGDGSNIVAAINLTIQ